MKRNNAASYVGSALVAVCLAGSLSYAQEQKISDQDLLNMMDSADEVQAAPVDAVVEAPVGAVVETPVDAVVEAPVETPENLPAEVVVDAAGSVADEVVVDAAESVAEEIVVDDLEVATVDEDVATAVGQLISVRLNRVSLEEAIDLFAQLSGANIIVPELTEAAQISVNLKDVQWRPALQSILDTYNYELYQRVSGSNVFSVRRRPAGAPEPQVVETFLLDYATVPNAAKLIRQLLPPDAKVSEFASRNMVVVKSTESSLSEVRSVLESIDRVRQQVYIESKFMELTDAAQKDLGIDWSVFQNYGVGASNLGYSRTKNESDSENSRRMYDSSGNRLLDLSEPKYVTIPAGGAERYQTEAPTVTKLTGSTLNEVSTAVLSADDFRVALSALEQNKDVNIVSNPKIIVANEEKANISIVRREPNLKQSRQAAVNDNADTIVYELDQERPFFDFGIKLDVTPSINTSSNITVSINPALTRKYADKPAGNNTYPIIDEKSVETVFNLANGQTAAIGGLTTVEEGKEEKKIPILGSIPYLGRLFSWKNDTKSVNETIIFVTVTLANTQQLEEGMGMPSDSELARRQIIVDSKNRKLRDHSREYFEAEEQAKLDDMIKIVDRKEDTRLEKRGKQLEKEAKREAKNNE